MAQNQDEKTLKSCTLCLCDDRIPDSTDQKQRPNCSSTEPNSNVSANGSPDAQKRKHDEDHHSGGVTFQSKHYKSSAPVSRSSSGDSVTCNLSPSDFPPGNTRDWNGTVLDRMRIRWKMVEREHPGDEYFFQSIINEHLINENDIKDYENYKNSIQIGLDLIQTIVLDILNPVDVNSVPRNVCEVYHYRRQAMEFMEKTDIDKFTSPNSKGTTLEMLSTFKGLFRGVLVSGKNFLETLEEMAHHQKINILTERMYERLFMEFLKMFNLNVTDLFISTTDLTIQIADVNHSVTSTPDLVLGFMDHNGDSSRKVLAICELKKNYSRSETGFTRKTSSVCKGKDRAVRVNHVSPDLIGKHGGELLVHLRNSVFKERGILGMIVQGTEVTLTALVPDKVYMSSLKDGLEQGLGEAKLFVSEPFNYLSREDRAKLCKPLLELFALQRFLQEIK